MTDPLARLADVHERERAFHDALAAERDAAAMPPAPPDVFEQALLGRFPDLAGRRVLDAGCGDGGLTLHLVDRGARVTALDLLPGMVDLVRRRVEAHRPGAPVDYLVAPAERTGLPDDSFDLIVGKFFLHHLDFGLALPELKRLLVPGGEGYFLETSGANPALMLLRRHVAGRVGVTRYGTPDEHPLERTDVERIVAAFGEGHAEFPLMFLAQLVDRHVTHWRHQRLKRALLGADAWLQRRPRLRPLSYYVAVYVRRPPGR